MAVAGVSSCIDVGVVRALTNKQFSGEFCISRLQPKFGNHSFGFPYIGLIQTQLKCPLSKKIHDWSCQYQVGDFSWLGSHEFGFAGRLNPFLEHLYGYERRKHVSKCIIDKVGNADYISGDQSEQNLVEQPYGVPQKQIPGHWDVIGLGQAMVDFYGMVDDDFLKMLNLQKGMRKVVNHEERGIVLRALDGKSYKLSAGGSLSNTLVALARLGMGRINVAMTGSVGSDALGDFYRTKLLRADVHFLSDPVANGTTGTVIVLTTPDAQRTMLSYQGMSSIVDFDNTLAGAISASKILVVEGYLWELPETIDAISESCAAAQRDGALVALTASDISCVSRYREEFWDLMSKNADILFANANEARTLCGFGEHASSELAAMHLSKVCPFVCVTDGVEGSYIGLKGEVTYIPSVPCVPVDTCGAGDAYAAGILYGLLIGMPDLKSVGNLAAKVASTVVSQQGTRLREDAALELTKSVASTLRNLSNEALVQ